MEKRVVENYLKVVFNAGEWSEAPVKIGTMASKLGLAPSSVSEAVSKLVTRGLLHHARYGSITLTEEGERIALDVVRKHRLIETFLVDYLGYTWDQVHQEAEILEHAVSQTFIDRLDQRLGRPRVDPHGDPIPRHDEGVSSEPQTLLSEVAPGTRVRIIRVSDDEPDLLRHLDELDIRIGTTVITRGSTPTGEELTVELDAGEAVLARSAVQAIQVTDAEPLDQGMRKG